MVWGGRRWRQSGSARRGTRRGVSGTRQALSGQVNPQQRGRTGMSKATRIRQQNARERIAAQRAAARRAEIRNRVLIVSGSVLAVIAIVVAFVVVRASQNSSNSNQSESVTGTVLPASVLRNVYTVPASTLNSVGIGSVLSYTGSQPITGVSDTSLVSGGKPEMLYIGAEFCPYCAAERWAMAVALSRFGTFTVPPRGFHSSKTDTDPNTPTLTFYKTSYTSPYLTFTPVENETVDRTPLQNTTSAQQALWVKYDSTSGGGVGYPFIDFGNKYVIKEPSYDPGVLAGLSWAQVASDLHNPSSPVAQGADGTANLITAAICKMTGDKPGSVCTSAGVQSASAHL
jgi:thiol-disulfide isomerase/thioredoxin